ncbi:MAG: iron uptake porin [Brasilonema octagenarum HA4186-MV1]|jgi:porin|uniref:S-layer protein n=2 Tax=Brasilonema TaxID=383614 RepID=A0A856MEZ7_9CYAN|nr:MULTISPECIES: iron uptake porin [Brasilonema]MBW4627932.1 iron uptake porin [Brasilonema octagenarum HA4186-MV1]NMF62873.1 S-layer protein [Brasilonema octagenarum UFV-OR1]QDL08719.1 S-layer protein [Brasilonema sennae CENA114]QDL15075.1 S-layer protein [Brasilonema octagenarum UFV-E1]
MQKKKVSENTIVKTEVCERFLTHTIASGVSLLSLLLLGTCSTKAQMPPTSGGTPNFVSQNQGKKSTSGMNQVTNVNQLSDVQPTDWAFQALQSLVERYGCIAGYPNGTFRGNRAMTRYEFAAGLNACLNRVNELVATATTDLVRKEDLASLQKLQEDFTAELATLRGRVDTLEAHTAELEANQFSTTTKLQGQAIISVNSGGFDGRRIIDPAQPPTANPITSQPNTTVLYRAGVDLNTSFFGTDLLKIRLDTGSGIDASPANAGKDNTAGLLEPNFGSVIDYSVKPPTNGDIEISRLYYSFQLANDFKVTIGPSFFPTDFVDFNSYAYLSFRDFSTLAFVNNFVLFPINGASAGAAIDWKPGNGAFSVRALYAATDSANPLQQGPGVIQGLSPFTNILYSRQFRAAGGDRTIDPSITGDRGFFGDTYQGTVEVEYAPSKAFALRLQYSGGELFKNRFDSYGVNVELTLSQKFGIFGRYGYGNFDNTDFGDIKPNYWMAGVGVRDLFTRGALAGVAVGQPFVVNQIGDSTQTNFEAFYNFPFSREIQVTPSIQVITHAGNQESNGTIVTGTLRTVFSF